MIALRHPRRVSLTEYPHRHVYTRNGSFEVCLYCPSWRPTSRARRDVTLFAGGLIFVALVGVLKGLS